MDNENHENNENNENNENKSASAPSQAEMADHISKRTGLLPHLVEHVKGETWEEVEKNAAFLAKTMPTARVRKSSAELLDEFGKIKNPKDFAEAIRERMGMLN